MPYDKELATDSSVRRLIESPQVQERLGQLQKRPSVKQKPPVVAEIEASDYLPDYVFGVDGSWHPLPVEGGFPGAEICFHSVVAVALKMAELRELDKQRSINPVQFRALQDVSAYDTVLTGTNVVRTGMETASETFRSYFYETLGQKGVVPEEETLLQTYEHLLKNRAKTTDMRCPYKDDCEDQPRRPFSQGLGVYKCPCGKRPLYSTDALDVHTSLRESGSSGRMYGEAQMVLEHLWLLNIIRALVRSFKPKTMRTLDSVAFVMDGPLRIDGEPAWLSWSIRDELIRLNAEVTSAGAKDLLIIGIEKSGAFVDHFHELDKERGGSPNKLARGSLFLLDNTYIRTNIAPGPIGPKDPTNSTGPQHNPYGYQTYYGRKMFYKTKTGALICAHIPFLRTGDNNMNQADSAQFARLSDVLSVLDNLGSARYPDAIIPVIAAHAETAIPLSQGRRVLEMLARSHSGVVD